MDKKNDEWLSISIFMKKDKWQLVINNILTPIVQRFLVEGYIISHSVSFNSHFNESIRFSLLVPDEKKYAIAKQVDSYFRNFLTSEKLLPVLTKKTPVDIFMLPFENSIEYGLYTININEKYTYLLVLEQVFSDLLLVTFADEIIDDDLILTFALYVLFSCYKVIRDSTCSFAERWQSYYHYRYEYLRKNEFIESILHCNYNSFEPNIDEIYSEVTSNHVFDNLAWLNLWESTFSRVWIGLEDSNKELFFSQVDSLVVKHLGLELDYKILLYWFISKTIKKYN